jgi:hypothetical protein
MVVGFNHNIKYKGEIFHIQTEDSGVNNPHIITLLYRGGNIIASKKTSYADIVTMANLDQLVEELMKEQHKEMLRRLKSAEFDKRLGLTDVPASPPATEPVSVAPATPPSTALDAIPIIEADDFLAIPNEAPKKEAQKQSLDDIIFDFLTAGDTKK